MSSTISIAEEIPAPAAMNGEVPVAVVVNGKTHEVVVSADQLLVDFLRETLGLTGTKMGCETGQCGVCTVLVDGVSSKSCCTLAAQVDGCHVTTIEGLQRNGSLNRLQTCFWEAHATQCGYCTPGMVLSMTDLLSRNAHPSEAEIRRWMDGNICRCGVYQNAVKAVQAFAGQTLSVD
jgi:carbon-monoxide dehydrogenase small subunit